LGILVSAYLAGDVQVEEATTLLLPVVLAVGLALFAAHDLYDRAVRRRNPGALIGAVLWWAGLLVIGSSVYPESGFTVTGVLLAALVALMLSGGLRFFYEQGVEWIYSRDSFRIPMLIIGEKEDRERLVRAFDEEHRTFSVVGEVDISGGKVNLPYLRKMLDETQVRDVLLAGAAVGSVALYSLARCKAPGRAGRDHAHEEQARPLGGCRSAPLRGWVSSIG
jgi:FlaA1/EpsC-like NDP-sugar epimerase